MRFGEATALQAQDWDAGNRRLSIVRAWKFSGGDGVWIKVGSKLRTIGELRNIACAFAKPLGAARCCAVSIIR